MAEVAIPALALGAMYILSNRNTTDGESKLKNSVSHNNALTHATQPNQSTNNNTVNETKQQENFDNISAPASRQLVMGNAKSGLPADSVVNYPVQDYEDIGNTPSSYPSPETATDRFYKQNMYEKQVESGKSPSNTVLFESLTGNKVQKKDIKFNNMVPFFGSKVTQRTSKYQGNESILDSYTGTGSQVTHKKEQAPLFAPHENLHYAHGMPNHTDFIKSRMNPSMKMNNTKPWEEIQVGPGLNKGFGIEGSGGFNSGMENREAWRDKTVDQLRTKTNPKLTFGLGNHEGPALAPVTNRGIEGKIEKHAPDTFYLNTPDRWFTTVGQEKAQRSRAEILLQEENRPSTTREYFGAATADQNGASSGGRATEKYRRSTRPELSPDCKYMGPAHNLSYANSWKNMKQNYGKSGYKSYPNARTTTKQAREFGIVSGWLKAAAAPILDILRPSRKENVIGNARPTGNVSGAWGVNQTRVWNPADRTKTTIREQTEITHDIAQPFRKHEGGYATTEYQPIDNQRQTTNVSYVGNSSATQGSLKGPVYNAAYNATINPNKEQTLHSKMNAGVEPLFNSSQNIQVRRFDNTNPAQGLCNMPKESGNISTFGEMSGRNTREQAGEANRNNPQMLSAFNNNPFTKPLNSVA